MPWYKTGTVSVTNGNTTVTGTSTLWNNTVAPGDTFVLTDANNNPTGAWYEVDSVTDNTHLELVQSYAGLTDSNCDYAIMNMTGNLTTPRFASRLSNFFGDFQELIDKPTSTPTASSIPEADGDGNIDPGWIKNATTARRGILETATASEAESGSATDKIITPSNLGALNYMTLQGFTDSFTVTVGAGADYASLRAALHDIVETYYSVFASGGSNPYVKIELQSGYVLEQSISVTGLNLSWIKIASQNDPQLIGSGLGDTNLFAASFNASLPCIECNIDMQGNGTNGIYLNYSAQAAFNSGYSIKNAGNNNLYVYGNSRLYAKYASFTGAGNYGLQCSSGTYVSVPVCDFSGSGASDDININDGIVFNRDGTGNSNISFNTITSKGTIFR